MGKSNDFKKPVENFLFDMEDTEPEATAKEPEKKTAAKEPKKTAKKEPNTTRDISNLQKILDDRKGNNTKETVCLTLRPGTKAALFKKAKKYGMSASELADIILADTIAALD